MGWVMPDPSTREAIMRPAFAGMARGFLGEHSALHIVDDGCAALWRSPEWVEPPPADGSGSDESPFPPDVGERFRILGELMKMSHPHEPHWYLNVLSTLPSRQGQGLGARALAPILARCDADGIPAYLESSNPRNMTLYRRHGFVETDATIDLPDGPSLYPMWRLPR
jgi:GNAT superfamily N-acetyltransferase